jgi:Domain of unknown function (DUF4252)
MNFGTRTLITRILVGLALCCFAARSQGQDARLQLTNLDKLSAKASHVTEVTLDGALLELAAKFIEMDDDPEAAQLKEIIKNLKGIYIKSFEFDEASQYSQADVEAIRNQLAGPGWTRIVTDIDKRTGEKNEIYLLKNGDKIAGVAILVAEARELSVVNIVGPVPIDKIAALESHITHNDKHDHMNKKEKEGSHEKK